jgi:hypothetical protein
MVNVVRQRPVEFIRAGDGADKVGGISSYAGDLVGEIPQRNLAAIMVSPAFTRDSKPGLFGLPVLRFHDQQGLSGRLRQEPADDEAGCEW